MTVAPDEVTRLLRLRRGHFRLESGHHGDLWLDLETLCLDLEPVRKCADVLAEQLRAHDVEIVCGPLVEGAFVALLVASALGVPFTYSVPGAEPDAAGGLYPMQYRLPGLLRLAVGGKRVAVVNDVVNAGSAVRGTVADLIACGADPVAIGTLAVLGELAPVFARDQGIALESLVSMRNEVWTPADCPLCAVGAALTSAGV